MDDKAHAIKVLTTPDAPERGVIEGVRSILAEAKCPPSEVGLVVHGTTLATNALIERKGARTALVTTAGLPRFAGDRLGAPLRAVRHLHGAARSAGAARPALRRARARRRRRRRASGARRAGGAPGRGRAAPAQDRGGGRLLPAQLHQRGARAARRRHPGRGAAGRGDLALAARSVPRSASTSAPRPPSPTPMCCRAWRAISASSKPTCARKASPVPCC